MLNLKKIDVIRSILTRTVQGKAAKSSQNLVFFAAGTLDPISYTRVESYL